MTDLLEIPKYRTVKTCKERFVFSVIGLKHSHIYAMCKGMLDAGAELKYVYDDDEQLLKNFLRCFVTGFMAKNEEEIFSDCETQLVLSADIPAKRAALAIRVMESGKNFFVDKAPVINRTQLNEVRAEIQRTGMRYFVFYCERMASECSLFTDVLIERGAIGKVVNITSFAPHKLGAGRPNWFFNKEATGGILIDIGSHQFEQILHFGNNRTAKILSGTVANYSHREYVGFEDFGDCHLLGTNGVAGYLRVDWLTPDNMATFGDGRLFLIGEKGFIELRKHIDIAYSHNSDTLFLVNENGEYKISVYGKIGIPYYADIIDDCMQKTKKCDSDLMLSAMELALDAQQLAETLSMK